MGGFYSSLFTMYCSLAEGLGTLHGSFLQDTSLTRRQLGLKDGNARVVLLEMVNLAYGSDHGWRFVWIWGHLKRYLMRMGTTRLCERMYVYRWKRGACEVLVFSTLGHTCLKFSRYRCSVQQLASCASQTPRLHATSQRPVIDCTNHSANTYEGG